MGRNRVLSFMSQFSASHRDSRTPTPSDSPPAEAQHSQPRHKPGNVYQQPHPSQQHFVDSSASPANSAPSSPVRPDHEHSPSPLNGSHSASPVGRQRSSSRPTSMVQTYQPPLMEVNEDTIPELQPIFTFLNNHQNKLYQEGYFLKLDDQDSKGRPNPDRTWTECFAQLVGTILSLWDAAELDAAGEDGEVLPKFINLTDASIKMIESLPTKSNDEQPLQNILSISTAGRNRYLLHFNSHHSLLQWTAGIRLAMFEQATLQEAYTGALIAGKGKTLNNINLIMDRTRFKVEEWVRVRFGAGVPWRRCWCVITPPDEKEYQKLQKELKKRSPYDRSHVPLLKGEIKFYDSKKEAEKKKKARPIASITDAYSAYAIYPQSRALIDGSTLLKVEGNIKIHSDPPSTTEGFVFIMPETPPAVSGFEMLLRFLFPTWDTFGLYGRPGRLVASVLDTRSLMFGMPKHKRYGYLEILDVTGLILSEGSSSWSEREWRKNLKELTAKRMSAMEDGPRTHGRTGSRSSKRLSYGPATGATRPRVNFADDSASIRSSPSMSLSSQPVPPSGSAPPEHDPDMPLPVSMGYPRHMRNVSDSQVPDMLFDAENRPLQGLSAPTQPSDRSRAFTSDLASTPERLSSEDEHSSSHTPPQNVAALQRLQTPEPVNPPPAFAHNASSRPAQQPYHSPELRRANSRLSSTTLSQLAKAGGITPDVLPHESMGRRSFDQSSGSVPGQTDHNGPPVHSQTIATPVGTNANYNGSREVLTHPDPASLPGSPRGLAANPQPGIAHKRSRSPLAGPPLDLSPSGPPPPLHQSPIVHEPPHRKELPRPSHYHADTGPHTQPPTLQGDAGDLHPGPPRHGTPPLASDMKRLSLQLQASPPPHRKPLPPHSTTTTTTTATHSSLQQEKESEPSSPSTTAASLVDYVVDEAALDLVQQMDAVDEDDSSQRERFGRHPSARTGTSSRYDDASSTTSPDYASTRQSTDTQGSVDRPRAGVLRTVGAAPEELPRQPDLSEYNLPDINFGPTHIPKYRPGADQDGKRRSLSPPSRGSSGPGAAVRPGRRSPNPAALRQSGHFRQDSDDTIRRRSVAWQPGGARVGSPAVERAITPEEFVLQRAAAASTPHLPYVHQRQHSANTLSSLRTATPTPPLRRQGSQELLGVYSSRPGSVAHSRKGSADLLQRPSSQGMNTVVSGGEISSHLSAREQEHVARVTGNPLLNVGSGRRTPQEHQGGLVGAIEARERERAQMMQGIGGQAVAQAIDQRQREQQFQAQRAAQIAYAQQQAQFAAQQQYIPGIAISQGAGPAYVGNMGNMASPWPNQLQQPHLTAPQGAASTGGWVPSGAQMYGSGQVFAQPGAYHRPLPSQEMGVQGAGGPGVWAGRAQSPSYHVPHQGPFPPMAGPGEPRPGTPGQMQFHTRGF
ncbi:hypothetical protein VTK73DRAFT_2626 [Phialemonium thermophilum]|uniref:PH domain-containing protein n=1 Tax=Phialemonium thermophilum TaxID=223376 RepID=A0ABR3X3P3_9PEZI